MQHSRVRTVLFTLTVIVLVAAIGLSLFFICRESFKDGYEPEYMTVEYEGSTYEYDEDCYNFLVLGIDTYDKYNESDRLRVGGQADSILVVSVNNVKRTISTVQINRDTYTKIPKLGVFGDVVGEVDGQIALAYAYGDGGQISCENTASAVSDLLGGIPIDGYFAVNMAGIDPFVDALGGVTVTLDEDFTEFDEDMQKGRTLLLNGRQSQIYLRGRKRIGDSQNTSRMKRNSYFYSELFKTVQQVFNKDFSVVLSVFNSIEEYSYYTVSLSKLASVCSASEDYERIPTVSPSGETDTETDEYTRFYADESSLRRIVLDTWYTKK